MAASLLKAFGNLQEKNSSCARQSSADAKKNLRLAPIAIVSKIAIQGHLGSEEIFLNRLYLLMNDAPCSLYLRAVFAPMQSCKPSWIPGQWDLAGGGYLHESTSAELEV